jgi:hypothetical protein
MRIILLLLLFPFSLKAQYSKIIEVKEKNADVVYHYAKGFSRNPDRFFLTNERVTDRNWVLGRVKWGNRRKLSLGLYHSDSTFREVIDKVIVGYQAKGGCVELMIITADMIIQCKDGRSKVSIENIRYAHYNTGAPPTVLPLKNENFSCGPTGSLQELIDCKACKSSVKQVLNFTDKAFQELIDRYEAYLSKAIADENW